MKYILLAGMGVLLATAGTAGSASAQDRYGSPPPPPCRDGGPRDGSGVCLCDYEATFYRPSAPWHTVSAGGPGVRIYGRPVTIESGRVDIQGPPIYVEAPPIRIRAPQIYLHAPEVHVRPSDVTVEPPEIHFEGCPDGSSCEPVGAGHGRGGERG
jgi:hypothetical protein